MSSHHECDDGYRMPIHELGGSGPVLLILHANGFHGHAYRPMAEAIEGYRCVGVDLRGHGAWTSPASVSSLCYRRMARDVLSLLAARGWMGRAFAFGHSLGGCVAAHAQVMHPGCFAGLYLYEPVIATPSTLGRYFEAQGAAAPSEGGDGTAQHALAAPAVVVEPRVDGAWEDRAWELAGSLMGEVVLAASALSRRDRFRSVDDAIATLGAVKPYKFMQRRALEEYVRHGVRPTADGEVELSCRRETEARGYLLMESQIAFQLFERMAGIRCPVVVARGEVVKSVHGMLARSAHFISAQVPLGRSVCFPGLYHLGPFEDPGAVGRSIRAFLDTCGTDSATRTPPDAPHSRM